MQEAHLDEGQCKQRILIINERRMTLKTEYFVLEKGVSHTKINQHLLVPKWHVEP